MQPVALMPSTRVGTAVALALTLASTTLISLAYLREHDAVGSLPALSLRRPYRSLRLLLGSRALVQIGLWLGGTCVVAVLVLTVGRAFVGAAAADGIAGGLLFSCGDISTKLATQGGARAAFALAAIFGYLLGTSLLQIGYQRGAALTIAGIATLLTNALPIAAGPVLLDETLPEGGLGVLRILAFVTVIAGAILLARPQPSAPDHRLDASDARPR
jgi:hypothetical protein